MIFLHGLIVLQVSLRDPLRHGAEDHELREIIGAAVCMLVIIAKIHNFIL